MYSRNMSRPEHLSLILLTRIRVFIQLNVEFICICFRHLQSSYCYCDCCWTFNRFDAVPVISCIKGQMCESYNKMEMMVDIQLEYYSLEFNLSYVSKLSFLLRCFKENLWTNLQLTLHLCWDLSHQFWMYFYSQIMLNVQIQSKTTKCIELSKGILIY